MNKLSKILLVVIFLLLIALSIMTIKFFKMKDSAKENFRLYMETNTELYKTLHPDAEINYDIDEMFK